MNWRQAHVNQKSGSVLTFDTKSLFENSMGSCFPGKGLMARRQEHTLQRSVTEEQRSQSAFCAKTLRAAGLLSGPCVGSVLTARCGDAPASPSWPQLKSLAAGFHAILNRLPKRGKVCVH